MRKGHFEDVVIIGHDRATHGDQSTSCTGSSRRLAFDKNIKTDRTQRCQYACKFDPPYASKIDPPSCVKEISLGV